MCALLRSSCPFWPPLLIKKFFLSRKQQICEPVSLGPISFVFFKMRLVNKVKLGDLCFFFLAERGSCWPIICLVLCLTVNVSLVYFYEDSQQCCSQRRRKRPISAQHQQLRAGRGIYSYPIALECFTVTISTGKYWTLESVLSTWAPAPVSSSSSSHLVNGPVDFHPRALCLLYCTKLDGLIGRASYCCPFPSPVISTIEREKTSNDTNGERHLRRFSFRGEKRREKRTRSQMLSAIFRKPPGRCLFVSLFLLYQIIFFFLFPFSPLLFAGAVC